MISKILLGLVVVAISGPAMSAEKSPSEKIADKYFEIAEVYAEVRKTEGACATDVSASQEEILGALWQAVRVEGLDEVRERVAARDATDRLFDETVSNNLSYRKLMGGFDSSYRGLEGSLVDTTLYSKSVGAYGSSKKARFLADNNVQVDELELLDSEPWSRWVTTKGKYSVELTGSGANVVLKLENRTVEIYEVKAGDYGEAPNFELNPRTANGVSLFSIADECDA